jgi:hypothetical protein
MISERDTGCKSVVYFDQKAEIQLDAGMNVLKTIFIMICLMIMSISLSSSAQTMVIGPIERMMGMIDRIRRDPLRPIMEVGAEEEDEDADETAKKKKKKKDNSYESAMLENTLGKIAALMQVGFGAAGADIIRANMASGDLNPMTTGKRITAIYMFCDIRSFTDTTECLQEEVMVYVNKIGHIMHGNTHKFFGMANKNVGDAFLLSWKVRAVTSYEDTEDNDNEEIGEKFASLTSSHVHIFAPSHLTPLCVYHAGVLCYDVCWVI